MLYYAKNHGRDLPVGAFPYKNFRYQDAMVRNILEAETPDDAGKLIDIQVWGNEKAE